MFKLAIETVNNTCSIALGNQDYEHIYFDEEIIPSQQSKILFPKINQAFKANKIGYNQLNEVIVNIGPGSFTGVRIGLASVKGLKIALPHLKFTAITSMEAIWAQIYNNNPSISNFAVILDASRNQLYFQQWSNNSLLEAKLIHQQELLTYLKDGSFIAGSGSKFFKESNYQIITEAGPNAKMLLQAAKLKAQNSFASHELQPFYMRAPDAKPKAK
ncbi:tRNA (adenosine(37)-N6)-threonylcarbamoyltransferase complex dimerization subunit type 1 TsaB [Rickettsiales endosymbiont of Stachyamoeba lipophora]|uniref:tRNA (adenosine(37)-N6)-threonylcarbamoyltransferase complex dimerization subunit type 1 TsaB n=1 Tax=Rickettsiales endosymbiont of Stachyamoeba lipophora TaxID=2486578 RepID=UPI000F64F07F|nr:tRNA (adenosine(37)-N6)-threonylcarbamoyltransferase complex dimerization subunit type 1 TsaB [Rickettsiales endosymbiont of Stachyamoeba lipophora]AZL15063.1 tRNA (adenosine(37)-N6)-threonylcarbamoyltransferase complex dimerization subunit type 1 TsaB [Rickettsiales endosymbiont of Stachyamoeba lipophora]